MERRDFLKGAAAAVVSAGILDRLPLGAAEPAGNAVLPDLVAVKGKDPAAMFDRAIAAAGGLKNFLKPGQKVVVKPNIGWNATPEEGADTNPALIGRIVKRVLEAGAAEAWVFDHTCDRDYLSCYRRSGIREAVESAGGKMLPGNRVRDYETVRNDKALRMKEARLHRAILDCDVFINVPVLKSHGGAKMTAAMKNLMGIVWDRRYMHRNDLNQCIADAVLFRRPTLNVVDAFLVMTKGGPTGRSKRTERVRMDSLLLSRDIVAVDAAACKLLGLPLDRVEYLARGEALGLGTVDLSKLRIERIV